MKKSKNQKQTQDAEARRVAIVDAVRAAGNAGMTYEQMGAVVGMTRTSMRRHIEALQHEGKLKRVREARPGCEPLMDTYYYASAEAVAAAMQRKRDRQRAAERERDARNRERRVAAARVRRQAEAKKKRQLPKPLDHQKLTINKPAQLSASEAFRAAPADYSRAKITRIPTPPPRFAPEPGWVRQITQDWRESRLQGLA